MESQTCLPIFSHAVSFFWFQTQPWIKLTETNFYWKKKIIVKTEKTSFLLLVLYPSNMSKPFGSSLNVKPLQKTSADMVLLVRSFLFLCLIIWINFHAWVLHFIVHFSYNGYVWFFFFYVEKAMDSTFESGGEEFW